MASRRSTITMSDEEIVAYLEEQKVLNVATIGPTGHPHVVAMWYVVLDGKPAFWTFGKSQKVMNIRRDPKITGLVESGEAYNELRGVELVGTARLLEDYESIRDLGIRVSTKYSGAPSDAALPFIEKQAQKRIGVVIDVELGRLLGPHQARRRVLTTPCRAAALTWRSPSRSGRPFETTAKRAPLTVRLVPA